MNKIALIITVLLFSLSLISCQKEVKKEIGLQLWSVREGMKTDAEGTIKAIGKMGYTFVETAGYADGQFYGMDPLEFKALLNENDLGFISSHTGQNLPDSSNWDEVMTWWDVCIDTHAKAGVQFIVQPWMNEFGYGDLVDLDRYCKYFDAVGAKCKAKGIKFGYHNHDKEFGEVDGIVRYDYMLQNTNPDNVFFQLDLYWIMKGGKNAVAYFEKYPGRFIHWHVKDEKELGESGLMDFETIWAAKEVSGMKYFIVEVERYNFEPIVSVEKSLRFLQEAEYVK